MSLAKLLHSILKKSHILRLYLLWSIFLHFVLPNILRHLKKNDSFPASVASFHTSCDFSAITKSGACHKPSASIPLFSPEENFDYLPCMT